MHGQCDGGSHGRNPGYWYMQPNYVEIWVESVGLQKDLISFQGDRKVKVVANGGFASTDRTARNCQRLKYMMDSHKHIEKVVILYFGDFDSSGDFLDEWLERALEFYGVSNFEVVRVAITPEQMLEHNLITDPEKTKKGKNKDPRFPRFNQKYPKLIERYGEKFGVQLEAFLTTDRRLEIFKKLVQDAIDEYWDEDIFNKNCPLEEYDYEAHGEEQPEDIDPDDVKPMMYQRITDAFREGWEREI